MKIGVTGTRHGASSGQLHTLRSILQEKLPEEFHHGCCVGADTQAHMEAYRIVETIVFHPPILTEQMSDLREFQGEWRKPKDYLERDRNIVDETDLLIALPMNIIHNICRDGTCYTVRYARKQGKPVIVIGRAGHIL